MPVKQLKNVKPGEIWIVKLSIKVEDTVGRETQKTRPCIIVANIFEAKMITIIPLLSNIDALNLPCTYLIKKNQKNRLKMILLPSFFKFVPLITKDFKIKLDS